MIHAIFADQPLLSLLFSIEVATGGDSVTVDVGHFDPRDERRPFASTHAATYRAIYHLADLDQSRFVTATGQSGNPLSRHYDDLTVLWAKGRSVPIGRDGASLPAAGGWGVAAGTAARAMIGAVRSMGTPLLLRAARVSSRDALPTLVNSLWINRTIPLSVATGMHAVREHLEIGAG